MRLPLCEGVSTWTAVVLLYVESTYAFYISATHVEIIDALVTLQSGAGVEAYVLFVFSDSS